MTADKKNVVLRWIDAVNRHDLDGIGELVAEDATWRVPIIPEPLRGRQAVQRLLGGFFLAFPDLHADVTGQIAEGDRVVTYITASGTHVGDLLGIPASGRRVSWPMIHTHTVHEGKLMNDHVVYDRLILSSNLELSRRRTRTPDRTVAHAPPLVNRHATTLLHGAETRSLS